MGVTTNDGFSDNWTGGSSHTSSHTWPSNASAQVYVAALTIVSTTSTPRSVTSITDTDGNTWTRVDSVSRGDFTTDITGAPIAATHEMWLTLAPTTVNSGTSFTFNFDAAVDGAFVSLYRFDGCDATHPKDFNGSMPAHASHANGSTSTPTISSLNCSTIDTMIIASQAGIASSGAQSVSGGLISGASPDFGSNPQVFGTNGARSSFNGKAFSSQQTNFQCTGGNALNNWLMIVFALTADAQSPPGIAKRNYRVQIG